MNNPKDFQVGDLVIAPRLFEGALPIYRIISTDAYPISVEDKDGCQYIFMIDGRENDTDLQPSLFHAGTKITIEEATPTRWPWVNVYRSVDIISIFTGCVYNTKTEALENIDEFKTYLHTCQLKPEGE